MTNNALPRVSRSLLEQHMQQCRNMGLALDKFAPWQRTRNWDLTMKNTRRRRGQTELIDVSGGEAKGLWLSTTRRANVRQGETPSLLEVERTDPDLMAAHQQRWLAMVAGGQGVAFRMDTSERLVVGLGAAHVLETGLTLERNTGLPYLLGSSVKGLARTWALFEVAASLGITLEATDGQGTLALNTLDDKLIELDSKLIAINEEDNEAVAAANTATAKLLGMDVSADSGELIRWFARVFGSQGYRGEVSFVSGIYGGSRTPAYAADVMTPHFVDYYTGSGSRPPSDDGNPQPVTFLTVEAKSRFWFGLLPTTDYARRVKAHEIAADWLRRALVNLGAGGKTAAGYGYFRNKSFEVLVQSD
ncbi:MAG: type III-B CRISPR module RAMP protein Cmr6 [Chloroflexota bacterium]